MCALVVRVVCDEEPGGDGGRGERVVGVQGFEQLGGLWGGQGLLSLCGVHRRTFDPGAAHMSMT